MTIYKLTKALAFTIVTICSGCEEFFDELPLNDNGQTTPDGGSGNPDEPPKNKGGTSTDQKNSNKPDGDDHNKEPDNNKPTEELSEIFKLIKAGDLVAIKEAYNEDHKIFNKQKDIFPFTYAVDNKQYDAAKFIIENSPDDKDSALNIFGANKKDSKNGLSHLIDKAKDGEIADLTLKLLSKDSIAKHLVKSVKREIPKDLRDINFDIYKKIVEIQSKLSTEEHLKKLDKSIEPEIRVDNTKISFPSTSTSIGNGASGTIFTAQYDGHEVAVKTSNNPAGDADLLEEARTVKKLNSSHIPKFYGLYLGKHGFGLVMERGKKSLADAIEAKERIDDKTILAAVNDMSSLKNELDKNSVDYSDIKPANLLIMNNGSIKAIDIDKGSTHAYLGSYGNKMAQSLLEAKLGEFLHPQYYGKKASSAFEKYLARVVYKKATKTTDASTINDFKDIFIKLDLANKTKDEQKALYYYCEYSYDAQNAIKKLKNKLSKQNEREFARDFTDMACATAKMKPEERVKEVFIEALGDAFSSDPSSELKAKLLKLYDLK